MLLLEQIVFLLILLWICSIGVFAMVLLAFILNVKRVCIEIYIYHCSSALLHSLSFFCVSFTFRTFGRSNKVEIESRGCYTVQNIVSI